MRAVQGNLVNARRHEWQVRLYATALLESTKEGEPEEGSNAGKP
jgi:hypothetical protein